MTGAAVVPRLSASRYMAKTMTWRCRGVYSASSAADAGR